MLERLLYQSGRAAVGVCAHTLFQMNVRPAPLPAGPKIIAANHPSTTDPFLILTLLPEHTSILIDDRLFKVPVFGSYLRAAQHIPVVPGRGREAFDAALALLAAGRSVAIFPEGAISPLAGGFHPARSGVARLALASGAPVIPVGIHLARERIRLRTTMIDGVPAVGTWYLGGPYAMTAGTPLHFTGDPENRALVAAVAERIMGRIIALAAESARRLERVPEMAAAEAA